MRLEALEAKEVRLAVGGQDLRSIFAGLGGMSQFESVVQKGNYDHIFTVPGSSMGNVKQLGNHDVLVVAGKHPGLDVTQRQSWMFDFVL